MVTRYIPDRGDVVWISLKGTIGHEQSGRRPAYVLSPRRYTEKTGMMVACPVTKQMKGYATEVIFRGKKIHGAVLVDHIQSRDVLGRHVRFIERIPELHMKILERLLPLIQ